MRTLQEYAGGPLRCIASNKRRGFGRRESGSVQIPLPRALPSIPLPKKIPDKDKKFLNGRSSFLDEGHNLSQIITQPLLMTGLNSNIIIFNLKPSLKESGPSIKVKRLTLLSQQPSSNSKRRKIFFLRGWPSSNHLRDDYHLTTADDLSSEYISNIINSVSISRPISVFMICIRRNENN